MICLPGKVIQIYQPLYDYTYVGSVHDLPAGQGEHVACVALATSSEIIQIEQYKKSNDMIPLLSTETLHMK